MKAWVHHKWKVWLEQKHPRKKSVILTRHNIYVLPSQYGCIFLFVVLSLFIGSINYQISSGFFLTFFLLTVIMISAWLGHQNINGMQFAILPIPDTAAESTFTIPIEIQCQQQQRFSTIFFIKKNKISWPGLTSKKIVNLTYCFHDRGKHLIPRIRIETRYPFGLFVVWSYLSFDQYVYVYPKPVSPGFWPDANQYSKQSALTDGDEEYYSLRQIDNPWLQPSRISWTAAAKGYGWYEKQFTSPEKTLYIFSTNQVNQYSLENGLQYISYWLIESENRGYDYAFNSAKTVLTGHGKSHLSNQLRQLAIYDKTKS